MYIGPPETSTVTAGSRESDSAGLGLYMTTEELHAYEKEKESKVMEKVQKSLEESHTIPLSAPQEPRLKEYAKVQSAVTDYQDEFPVKSGLLYKRGQSMKSWKQRYHVLELSHMDYFTDDAQAKHLGRVDLTNSTVDDVLILEDDGRILMHILTPTRIWRFHFISRDQRTEWYEAIVSRIRAMEHPYQKLLACRVSMRNQGRIYSSWDERFIRMDNCFHINVYNSDDIDSHELKIDLYDVTGFLDFEEGGKVGISIVVDSVNFTFVFPSEENRRLWANTIRKHLALRNTYLGQYEADLNKHASWDTSDHARFFGDFWNQFALKSEDFPGFRSEKWTTLGFGQDPMESFLETGYLGFRILQCMSNIYAPELKAIFEKKTNYPRMTVCLTTYVRLYKAVGQSPHFRRIIHFGAGSDPLENMTEIAFCIMKRFDKRWRKHEFEIGDLRDICEEFLNQLVDTVYHCNCLRQLKFAICRRALDQIQQQRKSSRAKSKSFIGGLLKKSSNLAGS